MKTFKEKIKKYSFWTGLCGAFVIVSNVIAKNFGFTIDNKIVEDVIMSICGVLVALGIVSAPVEEKPKEEKQNDENDLDLKNEK